MSAQLEEERQQYEEQLEIVSFSLKDDPDNAELLNLKNELEQMIKLIDDSLAELQPKRESTNPPSTSAKKPPPQQDQPPAQNKEKWSRDSHPAFKKAPLPAEEKEPEVSVTYRVNDNVMSKWVSGDKGFYPARITSVTGSSTNPIYTVKFKSYDTVETLRAKDIRPMAQKRKADGPTPASSGTNPTSDQSPSALQGLSPSDSPSVGASNLTKSTPALASGAGGNNGVVLTAEASLYPQAQQAGKDGQDAEEKPRKKFKKIKANKELEAGKNRWQEFNNKGKFGKTAKKESMFRTPEGVRGRVGFTGSGQAMRKDPTRSRHVYQPNEDLD